MSAPSLFASPALLNAAKAGDAPELLRLLRRGANAVQTSLSTLAGSPCRNTSLAASTSEAALISISHP